MGELGDWARLVAANRGPQPEKAFTDESGCRHLCYQTHTTLIHGDEYTRHMVLVQTIYDDGIGIGEANNEFVSPNPFRAAKEIEKRFAHLNPVRSDGEDPLTSFETSIDITIMMHYIAIGDGLDDA